MKRTLIISIPFLDTVPEEITDDKEEISSIKESMRVFVSTCISKLQESDPVLDTAKTTTDYKEAK